MAAEAELLSIASFGTLQGASAIAVLVPSVIGELVNLSKRTQRWIAFATAEVCIILAAASFGNAASFIDWVAAVLNGFLAFSAAVGLNQGGVALASKGDGPMRGTDPSLPSARRHFLRSWL